MREMLLTTSHNHASKYGGVIYYEDATSAFQCKYGCQNCEALLLPYCSVQFAINIELKRDYILATVSSHNDSSEIDGSFMYGGLLDRCQVPAKYSSTSRKEAVPFEVFLSDFRFDSFHAITSQPYQVCFCNDESVYDCMGIISIEVYRGQTFAVSLLALDQTKASTSTQINAKVRGNGRLKSKQSYQTLASNCSELKYTMYSIGNNEELTLYPDGPCRDIGQSKAVVNVTLLPCPHGFIESYDECICEEEL